MLDAWRRHRFCSKFKSTISQLKIRIEMVRKKRIAMQKYLKNDIADLLKTGFDVNAYERTEVLLVETNLLSCYDFLDRYCDHILSHLETMSRQRDCPEECIESLGSLMFAAARLADLPELRQLRTMFSERFGNSLECYVNKHFGEKLKPVPHTKVMKLQLMKEIAAEYGVEWNSNALQRKPSEHDMPRGQDHTDESGNQNESEAVTFNHENVRHQSRVSTTNREGHGHGEIQSHVANLEYNGDVDAGRKTVAKPKSVRREHLEPHSDNQDSHNSPVEGIGIKDHGTKIANNREVSSQSKPNGPSGRGRTTSLPVELEQTNPEELLKGHTRANSFQPDMFGPNGHTHPKLPNYDEVVARLADLGVKPKE